MFSIVDGFLGQSCALGGVRWWSDEMILPAWFSKYTFVDVGKFLNTDEHRRACGNPCFSAPIGVVFFSDTSEKFVLVGRVLLLVWQDLLVFSGFGGRITPVLQR